MTAVAEGLDLSFVTFAGDDETCDVDVEPDPPCSLEAVARAYFAQDCDHNPNPYRLCAGHRDLIAAQARESDGAFCCSTCMQVAFLVRMEPIR